MSVSILDQVELSAYRARWLLPGQSTGPGRCADSSCTSLTEREVEAKGVTAHACWSLQIVFVCMHFVSKVRMSLRLIHFSLIDGFVTRYEMNNTTIQTMEKRETMENLQKSHIHCWIPVFAPSPCPWGWGWFMARWFTTTTLKQNYTQWCHTYSQELFICLLNW